MLLTKTCYYWKNQVFGGASNRDMSLIEMCFCSRLYGIWTLIINVNPLCLLCVRRIVMKIYASPKVNSEKLLSRKLHKICTLRHTSKEKGEEEETNWDELCKDSFSFGEMISISLSWPRPRHYFQNWTVNLSKFCGNDYKSAKTCIFFCIFEKKYNDWIKCKLSKSKFKYLDRAKKIKFAIS